VLVRPAPLTDEHIRAVELRYRSLLRDAP